MVRIIGHRGASDDAPENTIASINQAFKQGADGIEIDIRLTKDQKIVCLHDRNTLRTTGQSLILKDTEYQTIKNLDAGSWIAERWKNEPIPLLEEVIEVLPSNKEIFIEVKTGVEIINPLISLILSSNLNKDNISIISFNDSVIKEIKSLLPEVTGNLLIAFDPSRNEKDLPKLLSTTGADGVGAQNHPKLNKNFVKTIKNLKKDVHVWTVNDEEEAKEYQLLGLSSITTNKPKIIKDYLLTSK